MMSDRKLSVTAVVLTLNEAANVAGCLESLKAFDDVLVVDSGSVDATVEIAQSLGARVVSRPFDNFAAQRNFAHEHVSHDWVFHLDADERMTPELAVELAEVIEANAFDAFHVPSRLIFLGKWLRYSGMYPTYQVRFGKRANLSFVQSGHGQREVPGLKLGVLVQPYDHDTCSKGLSDWLEKHNRYSSDEAADGNPGDFALRRLLDSNPVTRRRALKSLSGHLPFRPTLRFLYMYFMKRGLLDGREGYIYARLLAQYEYWIELKRQYEVVSSDSVADTRE